jgi:hypothetical protein
VLLSLLLSAARPALAHVGKITLLTISEWQVKGITQLVSGAMSCRE